MKPYFVISLTTSDSERWSTVQDPRTPWQVMTFDTRAEAERWIAQQQSKFSIPHVRFRIIIMRAANQE